MNDLYNRLMSLSDAEFEKLENAETELLKQLGVTKLHEFDNVGVGEDGELYALETLARGDEIIKNGEFFTRAQGKVNTSGDILDRCTRAFFNFTVKTYFKTLRCLNCDIFCTSVY